MPPPRPNRARYGVRRRPDYNRIANAVSRPGIDPRSWVCMARVDEDEDAIVWDDALGWLVDVTFVGGGSDGEGPINCRVASPSQGSGVGVSRPQRPNGLVIVLIPNGDPNDDAIIVGQLHDVDDFTVPSEVNGDTIVETDASDGEVAADETHITVAPGEDLDQQWRNARITADAMVLGAPEADQPFVRGTDLDDALDDLADAISDIVTAINTGLAAAGSSIDPASLASFEVAIATFKAASDQYLSDRITGD
jgi:hypothetical protein